MSTLTRPFFRNSLIEQFAAKPSTPISLRHLINFGNQGKGNAEQEAAKLIKSGNFLRTELPTRLSHRLRDLQSLPYAVTSHPQIEKVYDLYVQAFDGIRNFPEIKSTDDNDKFCEYMEGNLDLHRQAIPALSIGVAESSPKHLSPTDLDRFMTRMLRSRISRRVITEQHIHLTRQFRERERGIKDPREEGRVGVIDTNINAALMTEECIAFLKTFGGLLATIPFHLEGDLDRTFAYIPEHLEFMIFEIIKAAAVTTVRTYGNAASAHPITVTLIHSKQDLSIRVSDTSGGLPPWGGLPPCDQDQASGSLGTHSTSLVAPRLEVFSFSHMRRVHLQDERKDRGVNALKTIFELTGTVKEQTQNTDSIFPGDNNNIMALDAQTRSGIGLPLARLFAEYFGGSLVLYSLMGHGCDTTLQIKWFGNEEQS